MDQPTPVFPEANDPLGEVLHQLRLDGSLYCRSVLQGDWSVEMPPLPGKMMFHIITEGECWLALPDETPIKLKQGALVLIPHGTGHTISRDPEILPTPLFDYDVLKVSERYEILEINGEGDKTELTCGVIGFDQFAGKQLIQQLPPLMMLDEMDDCCEQWLSTTLEFISNEAKFLRPGGETIITHLADILVLQVIRHWMETAPQASQGWVGALKDKHIGVALKAIHHSPEKNWTVESLAQECGMSRSGFSAHFKRLVGNSVKNYLTEWRMHLAYQRLKFKNEPLIVLAEELGYQSEAAFARAFKRVMGVTPGRV